MFFHKTRFSTPAVLFAAVGNTAAAAAALSAPTLSLLWAEAGVASARGGMRGRADGRMGEAGELVGEDPEVPVAPMAQEQPAAMDQEPKEPSNSPLTSDLTIDEEVASYQANDPCYLGSSTTRCTSEGLCSTHLYAVGPVSYFMRIRIPIPRIDLKQGRGGDGADLSASIGSPGTDAASFFEQVYFRTSPLLHFSSKPIFRQQKKKHVELSKYESIEPDSGGVSTWVHTRGWGGDKSSGQCGSRSWIRSSIQVSHSHGANC